MTDVMNRIIVSKIRNAKYFPLKFDDITSNMKKVKLIIIWFAYFQMPVFHIKLFFFLMLKNFPGTFKWLEKLYKSFIGKLQKLNAEKWFKELDIWQCHHAWKM